MTQQPQSTGQSTSGTPESSLPLIVTHGEMNTAYDGGRAVPLGDTVCWTVRYRSHWWVVYEGGWLRVTDDQTAADLDRTAARLTRANAITARDVAVRGAFSLPHEDRSVDSSERHRNWPLSDDGSG